MAALCSYVIEGPIEDAYLRAVYAPTHQGKPAAFSFTRGEEERPTELDLPSPWAIITAHNPMSDKLDDGASTRGTAEFMELLHAERLASEPAQNSATDGSWCEPGRIVFGISRERALEIGRRLRQRAIVWSEQGRVGVLDCRTERWTIRPVYPRLERPSGIGAIG